MNVESFNSSGEIGEMTRSCTTRSEVLQRVRENGMNLEHFGSEFKSDKEVVLEAVKQDSRSLKFCSDEMKNDKDVVLEAAKERGWTVRFASERLRNDKEVAYTAIMRYNKSLKYFSEELRNDGGVKEVSDIYSREGLYSEGGSKHWKSLESVSEALRDDFTYALLAVRIDGMELKYVGNNMKNNRDIIIEAARKTPESFEFAGIVAKADKTTVIEVVRMHGRNLEYASEELKNDRDVVVEACRNDLYAFSFIGNDILEEHYLLRLAKESNGDIEKVVDELEEPATNYVACVDSFWESFIYGFLKSEPQFASYSHIPEKTNFPEETSPDEERERKQEILLRESLSKIRFDDLIFFRCLGKGAFGITYLCQVNGLSGLYAVKVYRELMGDKHKALSLDGIVLEYDKNVASSLGVLQDVINIQKFPDYEDYWKERYDKDEVFHCVIIMKYHRKTLLKFFNQVITRKLPKRKYQPTRMSDVFFDSFDIPRIIVGLLQGVSHLNSNLIVHRDLHMENVFVDTSKGRVWIGDFGCCLDLRKNPTGFKVKGDRAILFTTEYSQQKLKVGGYPKHLPPEILDFLKEGISKEEYIDYEKCDIFSVGAIASTLLEMKIEDLQIGEKMAEKIDKKASFFSLTDFLLKKKIKSWYGAKRPSFGFGDYYSFLIYRTWFALIQIGDGVPKNPFLQYPVLLREESISFFYFHRKQKRKKKGLVLKLVMRGRKF